MFSNIRCGTLCCSFSKKSIICRNAKCLAWITQKVELATFWSCESLTSKIFSNQKFEDQQFSILQKFKISDNENLIADWKMKISNNHYLSSNLEDLEQKFLALEWFFKRNKMWAKSAEMHFDLWEWILEEICMLHFFWKIHSLKVFLLNSSVSSGFLRCWPYSTPAK